MTQQPSTAPDTDPVPGAQVLAGLAAAAATAAHTQVVFAALRLVGHEDGALR